MIFRAKRILTPAGWLEDGEIEVQGGRIKTVRSEPDLETGTLRATQEPVPDPVLNLSIVPGFIDLHVHGGAGSDFMDASPEAVVAITEAHAAGGTTAMLATTASHSRADILGALQNIKKCRDERVGSCEILGAHVEGPYFAASKKGCHLVSEVRPPDRREWSEFLDTGVVKHMTLAPEIKGAEDLVRALVSAGATASAGHSEATADEVRRAMDWGLRHVTHLYCAMSGTVKKGPERIAGLLEAALLEEDLTAELISDGMHVNPDLARLAYKNKGTIKMALVTDAMRGLGMPDGVYPFGGKEGTPARVGNGAAQTLDGSGFASGVKTMLDCVKVAVEIHGQPLEEALRRASETPARIAGVWDRKGSIEAGKDADLVLLGPGLEIKAVIAKGKVVWGKI